MGKKQYQVISPWEDKGRKPLYPKSDRIKHIVQSARVIRRSMEINLSENDTNLLYDTSHRCRSERVQPLMGSKQSSFWHGRISRFFRGDRRISRSQGPDRIVQGHLTGRSPLTESQLYVTERYQPEPLSVAQNFGEELGAYQSRIEDYENLFTRFLAERLPSCANGTSNKAFLDRLKLRILVNLWLILPGHAHFTPTETHWERLIDIGKVWVNLQYKHTDYPALFVRKCDSDEFGISGEERPSTSAQSLRKDEPDPDPFIGPSPYYLFGSLEEAELRVLNSTHALYDSYALIEKLCGSELRQAVSMKLYSIICDQFGQRMEQLISGHIRHENEIRAAFPFCFTKDTNGVLPPAPVPTQFNTGFLRYYGNPYANIVEVDKLEHQGGSKLRADNYKSCGRSYEVQAFTSLDEEVRRTHPPSTRDEINRQNFKLWNLCGRPKLPLLTDYHIGVGRTPGYATVHRFLHDQRPYGAPDKTGLYRITGHGDRKPIRDPYKPVEKITSADTCRRGQKSLECFFSSATHALAPDVKEGEQIQIIGRTIKFRENSIRKEFLEEIEGHDQYPHGTPYIQAKSVKRARPDDGPSRKRYKPEPLRRPQASSPDLEASSSASSADNTAYVFVPDPGAEPIVEANLVEVPALQGGIAEISLGPIVSPEAPILPLSPAANVLPEEPTYQVQIAEPIYAPDNSTATFDEIFHAPTQHFD